MESIICSPFGLFQCQTHSAHNMRTKKRNNNVKYERKSDALKRFAKTKNNLFLRWWICHNFYMFLSFTWMSLSIASAIINIALFVSRLFSRSSRCVYLFGGLRKFLFVIFSSVAISFHITRDLWTTIAFANISCSHRRVSNLNTSSRLHFLSSTLNTILRNPMNKCISMQIYLFAWMVIIRWIN